MVKVRDNHGLNQEVVGTPSSVSSCFSYLAVNGCHIVREEQVVIKPRITAVLVDDK